jgi:hypothetical protein
MGEEMRSFQSALTNGHRAERAWVDTQRASGLSVAHGKKLILKKHCKVKDHCETPDAAVLLTVEIKERNLTFTSPEDFPYDTVFIDDLRGLSRETLRPFAYVFVSRATKAWVWVTPLDQDETWTEQVVRDTTRGHEMGMLVAPKSHLRPAKQLLDYITPHNYLELVDGDCSLFVHGGGDVEERERYVAQTNPEARGRGRKAATKTRNDMG